MKHRMQHRWIRRVTLALGTTVLASNALWGQGYEWKTVVNNGVTVPGGSNTFNSYNQPSVNTRGLVVFRGRSKGGSSGNAHGVYTRDMAAGTPIVTIFDRNTEVPYPNNLSTLFVEPPAFPRIDIKTDSLASRGSHAPVWNYQISADTETRAGTTGVYTKLFGTLTTGASKLGVVPAFPFYAVPETTGIPFDVFPGAPAVTNGSTIVFKGNFTIEGVSKTGVFYRNLQAAPAGGAGPTLILADTNTTIPGTTASFGAMAPPSAAGRQAVFTGWDNEAAPTIGGLYMATLSGSRPALTPLVAIGTAVPGETGASFSNIGEGLSFDGRFVAFWGTWGTQTKSVLLSCPTDGRAELVAFCLQQYPAGFTATVPVNQGIFVYDTTSKVITSIAKTPGDFADFMYWTFSGFVPGTGESDEDGEPARWRAASFMAVSGAVNGSLSDPAFHVAFKGRRGQLVSGQYQDVVDGLYMASKPGTAPFSMLVESGLDGAFYDPAAVDPDTQAHLPITAMGLERDGFRGNLLAINLSMATEAAGWAGIYLAKIPNTLPPACASDLTFQFNVTPGEISYNSTTRRYVQNVTVTRTAASGLSSSFALALENLSSNAKLYNAAGTTTCIAAGSPYVVLDPGASWSSAEAVTVTLEFVNPSKKAITYTPAVLSGTPR